MKKFIGLLSIATFVMALSIGNLVSDNQFVAKSNGANTLFSIPNANAQITPDPGDEHGCGSGARVCAVATSRPHI